MNMLIELAKLYVISSLFLLYCAANGFAVLKVLAPWQKDETESGNRYLKWFFAISLGLVLNVTALFVLGLVGWLNMPVVLGLGFFLLVLAMLLVFRKQVPATEMHGRPEYGDALVLAVLLALTVMAAMHAPGHWDDTMYQLPLARSYLLHEAIVVNEYLRFPLFPQNVNLLITLGLMLGGDVTAQVFATLPLFVMAIGLLGAAQWIIGSIVPGALAAVTMLFVLDPIRTTLGYAYIDNGLALFCWGATLALALWPQYAEKRHSYAWLIIAGILAGGAVGTKYFGGVYAVLAGAYLLLIRRDRKSAAIYSAAVIVTGSWWYVRSFLISGDPVHPAGGNIFGYFLWDAADLLAQKQEQGAHGVPPSSLNIWGALEKAGTLAWILAFATLAFRKLQIPMRCFQFFFFSYLVFWFFVTQVDRYLAPIYAVGTFLSWYVVYRIYLRTPAKQFFDSRSRAGQAQLSLLVMMLILAPLTWQRYQKAELAMAEWQTTLESRAGYEIFSEANKLIPRFGDRILQIGFENAVYFFDGTVIGDWFGPGRYRNMLDCEGGSCGVIAPEKMKLLMERFGAKMLAVSTARFPEFNKDAYQKYFDFILIGDDGLLMVLRPS